jgi:hypothetical protein
MTVRFLRWFFRPPSHPGWAITLGLGIAGCGIALSVGTSDWGAYALAALGSLQVVLALVALKIHKRQA